MSNLEHIKDNVKTHFISGEPGTTGREPFEDSTATGPGANFTSGTTGNTGTGVGATGHSHHHDHHDRQHHHDTTSTGTGVTGETHHVPSKAAGTAAGPEMNTHGLGSSSSHGTTGTHTTPSAAAGTAAGVDMATSGSGAHAAEKSHYSNDTPNRHTNENDDRSIVDKAKDAMSSKRDPTARDDHAASGATTGTFANSPATYNRTAAEPDNRNFVDKINDALPGTPAKHGGNTHSGGAATAGGVVTAEQAVGAGSHGHHGHHGHTIDQQQAGQAGLSGAGERGSGVGSGVGREHGDRVGALGQDSAKYEGGLHSAPKTSGAAGTDRFDAPSTGGVADRSRVEDVHQNTSQRAPGQSSGGIGGIMGTSDKDFTGRERQGTGAYADTDGKFDLNKSGPAGNTALTGREGNLDNNPVAERHGTDATNTHAEGAADHEKKGFMAKVKDALHK